MAESLLLTPSDLTASRRDFEVVGVFNPGAVGIGKNTVLLVRVAERPAETRAGFLGLPRWSSGGECVVDWISDEDVITVDPRVVRLKSCDRLRLTSISHLRVFTASEESQGPWLPGPALLPDSATEEFGIEDPRITKIDQTYWITYVAVSRFGAATALASSDDMVTFHRHGIIFCPENKDVVLFPQRINGQYVALHRPNPNSHFSPPQIWTARSPDLTHWGQHQCVHQGAAIWEGDRVGGGTPPVLTDEGWLHLYHGSQRSGIDGRVGPYCIGALLLDGSDPGRILARSSGPIMRPVTDYERNGFVPGIVFATALIPSVDMFRVYYGAADTYTAVVEFAKQDVMNSLR